MPLENSLDLLAHIVRRVVGALVRVACLVSGPTLQLRFDQFLAAAPPLVTVFPLLSVDLPVVVAVVQAFLLCFAAPRLGGVMLVLMLLPSGDILTGIGYP